MIKHDVHNITNLSSQWKPCMDCDKIRACVVIDSDASARSAVRMMQRVAKTINFRLTLLDLDKSVSRSGDGLARVPLDSELLIFAMGHGGELPGIARTWIERWVYLRRKGDDCALVAFVTNASFPLDSDSPLVVYLDSIATAHGLTFFYGNSQDLTPLDPLQPHECFPSATTNQIVTGRNPAPHRWGINE